MEKILDNNYYDLFLTNLMIPSFSAGNDITPLNSEYSLLHVGKNFMQPCDLGQNPYHMFPSIFSLTSTISASQTNTDQPQSDSDFNLLGQGVLTGIIDTGIDYQHPAFMNPDKSTRIISIWDQTIQDGLPPNGFTFGTEYLKPVINNALRNQSPLTVVPSEDLNGHGTAIASIAAGSIIEQSAFRGVSPSSELIIVKLKEAKQNLKMIYSIPDDKLCFQESDIILGVRYLITIAKQLQRPLIICLALGSSQGNHDGRGVLSRYIENLVRIPDLNFSISAGNEGNTNRHYFTQILSGPYVNDIQLNVGNEDKMFAMEIWLHIPGRLSIEITAPNQETIPFIQPSFDECDKFIFQSSQSIIYINNMVFERGSGDQMILLRFENMLEGIWHFKVKSTENEPFTLNSWIPSGDLISNQTYFLQADPNTTITEPGNVKYSLTVTAYNQQTGDILDSSGRGYTRSGLVKPDIAAPGFQVPFALPRSQYGTLTGTGAAAAYATGASAIVFEWTQGKGNFTYITGEQLNRMLIRGAKRDSHLTYPNNIWGYGKLDVFNILKRLSMLL